MNEKRISILTGIFLILLSVLLFRSFFLSIKGGNSSVIPNKSLSLYSSRGIIYDCNNIPIVSNSHKFFYYFDTAYYKKVLSEGKVNFKTVEEQILKYFDIDIMEFEKKLDSSSFILLGYTDTEKYTFPNPLNLFVAEDHRNERNLLYDSMIEVVGKVDSFGSGVNGVEAYFDRTLSPKESGKVEYQTLGKYSRMGESHTVNERVDGEDVKLSLDINFQNILKQTLEEGLIEYEAKSVQGIILESKTGKVKGMYSTMGWNSLIMGIYEPGSVIKPFTFAQSDKYGLLKDDWIFECTGKIKPYPNFDITIKDTHVHGRLDLTGALSESCNVAAILIALDFLEQMDDWTFYQGYMDLGFGNKTGIEFPGEVSGIVHSPKDWNLITGVQMSFGHGLAVTPIQLVSAFNVFANNGVYIPPTLLDNKNDSRKEKVVYTSDTANKIKTMMIQTVESGTGKSAKISNLSIAAKTGTAEIAYPGQGYVEGKYNSTFAAIFPADDPVYTVLITVEEPGGDLYYGGDVAAPLFKSVVEKILKYLEKPLKTDPDPIILKGWNFPDLLGLTRKDVLDILDVLEIDKDSIVLSGEGAVIGQIPDPGTLISDVDKVEIKFGTRGELD